MTLLFNKRRILFLIFFPFFTLLTVFGGGYLLAAESKTSSDDAVLSELKTLNGQTSALERKFDDLKSAEDDNKKDVKALKPWMAGRPGRKHK
ncbi:MAG: hypothetical protein PHE61_03025 [Candidatus Omnitrophica bacterium]|nr:hypothetical protein [Candidatus Omnitrophota bacterium]